MVSVGRGLGIGNARWWIVVWGLSCRAAGTAKAGVSGAGGLGVPGLLHGVAFLGLPSTEEPGLQKQVSQETLRSYDLRSHRGPLLLCSVH